MGGEQSVEGPDFYRADHHPQVGADVLALPTPQLQRIALIRISQLTRGELIGKPLGALEGHPDLSDCRKLYFDETDGLEVTGRGPVPKWRIVYRLRDAIPGADGRTLLQVVAVGARSASSVYETAGAQLGRPRIIHAPKAQEAAPVPRRGLAEAQQLAVERLRLARARRR